MICIRKREGFIHTNKKETGPRSGTLTVSERGPYFVRERKFYCTMNQHTKNRRRRRRTRRRAVMAAACFLLAAAILIWGAAGAKHLQTPLSSQSGSLSEGQPWYLILVNRWNPIPDNYAVTLTWLSCGQAVDARVYPALQAMFDAARAEGIYPTVTSGYRTRQTQQDIMDSKVEEYTAQGFPPEQARQFAELWVSPPGTSEHELGLAVDINAEAGRSTNTAVYRWLYSHAHLYGFILRYPEDKTDITGVSYEPWHYRYVGVAAAGEIYRRGLCLEEYLSLVRQAAA